MTNEESIPEQLQNRLKLESIFMPFASKRRDEFYRRQTPAGPVARSARFVHYTSAGAALSIINGKRMWMRNALCMSDYREVQHGFASLQGFFSDNSNASAFTTALDQFVPGATKDAITSFDQWWNVIQRHTYITSVSEHDTAEDQHGRLSMWRAFGNTTTRVAIVLNVPWNSGGADALKLIFAPIVYLTQEQVHAQLRDVISNIAASGDFLRSYDRATVVATVQAMLLSSVACLKHEGFREEREWRAAYFPHNFPSPFMNASTEVINGVPQLVYKIPLDGTAAPELAGLEFSRIFDRLIIGPSPYPLPLYDAFAAALTEAGVPEETAKRRVVISGIPIRV